MTKLREIRKQTGLSQIGLAVRAGIPSCRLCCIEQGERCTQPTARKLARALGVKVEVVFPKFKKLRDY